jgi:hypothetical protein
MVEKPKRFNLVVKAHNTKTKVYKLLTETDEDRLKWLDYLERAISGALET